MSDTFPTRRDEEPRAAAAAASRAPSGTRRDDVPAEPIVTPYVSIVLPPRLAQRFEVLREMPTAGTEAWIVLVQDAGGDLFALKLYKDGFAPDTKSLNRLAGVAAEHVVTSFENGWESGLFYELMEWCPHGSLRDLMISGQEIDPRELVTELTSALIAVQAVGIIHRDIKPENVLVRTIDPLDLVLGDFGITRQVSTDVHFTAAWGTRAYAPPEADSGALSQSWDWWSVGMILLEIFGGNHPFSIRDEMLPDQSIAYQLSQQPVDVSAVEDPDLRELCGGLLHRSIDERWGASEVGEWLAGRHPTVRSDGQPLPQPTVWFGDEEHDDVAVLTDAMAGHWALAVQQLVQERNPTLVEELDLLLDHAQLPAARRALNDRTGNPHRLLAALLAEMHPRLRVDDRAKHRLATDVTAMLSAVGQLPRGPQQRVDQGVLFQQLFTLSATGTSPRSQHRARRRRRHRSAAAERPWWNALYERSSDGLVEAVVADALFDVAVEESRQPHLVNAGQGLPLLSPPPLAPLPTHRKRRAFGWFVLLLVLAGAGAAAAYYLPRRDTGASSAPNTGAPPATAASTDPPGATGDAGPAVDPPAFAPEFGLWGAFPQQPKEAIGIGSAGDAVRYLQGVLVAGGGSALEIDGRYGPKTASEVEQLQAFFELPVTGEVDAATWAAIDLLATGGT